jgi:hypothetical protein
LALTMMTALPVEMVMAAQLSLVLVMAMVLLVVWVALQTREATNSSRQPEVR